MTLRTVRAHSNRSLWDACVAGLLGELGECSGPTAYPSYLWLTHRLQREALYQAAAHRGRTGWLSPPVAFFSDLPQLFHVQQRPIGLLARRGPYRATKPKAHSSVGFLPFHDR